LSLRVQAPVAVAVVLVSQEAVEVENQQVENQENQPVGNPVNQQRNHENHENLVNLVVKLGLISSILSTFRGGHFTLW
jgi:hypothetical protein